MSTPLETRRENPPDALIARVLTGLRDTQPSPGMNGRIFHAIQLQASESQAISPPKASRLACILRRPWPSTAAALTAASLLLLAIIWLRPHPSRPTTAAALIPGSPLLSQAQTAGFRASLSQAPSGRSTRTQIPSDLDPRAGVTLTSSATTPESAVRPLAPTPYPPADQARSDPDAEALADTLAPSHPAPPLPLTPQEKLLLRVLQRDNPIELAELDPLLREASFARDQAAYQKFFRPPPPLPQDPTPAPTPAETQPQVQAQPQDQAPTQTSAAPTPGDQP